MAKKLSDLKDDKRSSIQQELNSRSSSLGLDSWDSQAGDVQTGLKHILGMCASCKELNYCKSEFGNVYAMCYTFDIRLTGKNRITECNKYTPKNALSLNEMYNIAYLIDGNTNKKVKGFVDTNKKGRK